MGVRYPSVIVLIGMMGSGKSTTARLVAAKLGAEMFDVDDHLTETFKRPCSDVLREDPQRFRDEEAATIARILRERNDAEPTTRPLLLSVGGGALDRVETVAVLGGHCVVWLRAPAEVLLDRVRNDSRERPMLDGDMARRMDELLNKREPIYAELATHVIDVGGKARDTVADLVGEAVRIPEEKGVVAHENRDCSVR